MLASPSVRTSGRRDDRSSSIGWQSNRVGISKQLRSRHRTRATPIAYHGGAADHHDFIDSHRGRTLRCFRFDPCRARRRRSSVTTIHSFIRLVDPPCRTNPRRNELANNDDFIYLYRTEENLNLFMCRIKKTKRVPIKQINSDARTPRQTFLSSPRPGVSTSFRDARTLVHASQTFREDDFPRRSVQRFGLAIDQEAQRLLAHLCARSRRDALLHGER